MAQLALDIQSLGCRLVHVRSEELVIVPAGGLGVVHRRVGIFQDGIAVGAVIREDADADRRAGVQFVAIGPRSVSIGRR